MMTTRPCPGCGAKFVERTHGGDVAVFECGTTSDQCTDGCCGDFYPTAECESNQQEASDGNA